MYCPKCAQANSDDAKFCRTCGENLTVIAQAMSKHLPVMIASKLDEHIARKENRLRRDGLMTGLSGILLLFSGIWQVAAHTGAWVSALFMFVGAFILLLASGWDLLAYKRFKSRNAGNTKLPAAETGELEASSLPRIPAASVTEQTTRRLERAASRSGDL
ncbi:MAG TPA: zinc ribbon domain-containing protein [Pyrinomonadaceae bacterium]|nr:zinc ribbon domain-containing protein [Pyrinomonadaceae bacterium]